MAPHLNDPICPRGGYLLELRDATYVCYPSMMGLYLLDGGSQGWLGGKEVHGAIRTACYNILGIGLVVNGGDWGGYPSFPVR